MWMCILHFLSYAAINIVSYEFREKLCTKLFCGISGLRNLRNGRQFYWLAAVKFATGTIQSTTWHRFPKQHRSVQRGGCNVKLLPALRGAKINTEQGVILIWPKMPVGCLGGGGNSAAHIGGNASDMEVIVTSSVLNSADQFAFMQQTLLMQIFRVHHPSSASSSSSGSSNHSLNCPTCIAFNDQCCQMENGIQLFHEFLEANLHCSVWDQKLSDALSHLRWVKTLKMKMKCIPLLLFTFRLVIGLLHVWENAKFIRKNPKKNMAKCTAICKSALQ